MFNKINVMTEMLTYLIGSVQLRALEFVKYSDSKLSKVKNANQKYFNLFFKDFCDYFLLFRLICIKGN